MTGKPDILCIGSVLWDVVGRAPVRMKAGHDVPGRITLLPGGVAMNVAMTLARFGMRPALLTAVGRDASGEQLLAEAQRLGLDTAHVHRGDAATDRYMAIEGSNGLVAAIADAHGLEAAGDAILAPLDTGPLGTAAAPWEGLIALDGNLTEALLADIAHRPSFARADLRIAPASPGKVRRLLPLLRHRGATLYMNLIEANLMLGAHHESTERAAEALLAAGANRVLVTDGANPASLAAAQDIRTKAPPAVTVRRVTGAGDTFMAAHISAEYHGKPPEEALDAALEAAARYISTEDLP
jgi:sugar/nucleoside kinase (ribokinase family)